MKNYIMIALVAMHLISSSLFATNIFVQKQHYTHQHTHTHSGSIHQHQHTHSQSNSSFFDLLLITQVSDKFVALSPKESYTEKKYFISNPTLESIFRPPIV